MKNGGRDSLEKTTQEESEAKLGIRNKKNPLDMYDDMELYDKFRFRHHNILTIVDELHRLPIVINFISVPVANSFTITKRSLISSQLGCVM